MLHLLTLPVVLSPAQVTMGDNTTSGDSLLDSVDSPSTALLGVFSDPLNNFSFWDDNDTDPGLDINPRGNGSMRGPPGPSTFMMAQLPFYVLIFLLSVVGNILVIITVIQNKKMRSLTNVFLLNLSVADLLLSVFCMPFTLIPIYLRNFIFGEVICILVRYLAGESKPSNYFSTWLCLPCSDTCNCSYDIVLVGQTLNETVFVFRSPDELSLNLTI